MILSHATWHNIRSGCQRWKWSLWPLGRSADWKPQLHHHFKKKYEDDVCPQHRYNAVGSFHAGRGVGQYRDFLPVGGIGPMPILLEKAREKTKGTEDTTAYYRVQNFAVYKCIMRCDTIWAHSFTLNEAPCPAQNHSFDFPAAPLSWSVGCESAVSAFKLTVSPSWSRFSSNFPIALCRSVLCSPSLFLFPSASPSVGAGATFLMSFFKDAAEDFWTGEDLDWRSQWEIGAIEGAVKWY